MKVTTPIAIGKALFLCIPVILALQACSGANANPRSDLSKSIDDYHQHLTWGRYAEAAGYLPIAQRNEFIGIHDEIGDELRFTEYELGTIDLTSDEQEATVAVTLSWYTETSQIVQDTRLEETWTYDEESEFWFLTQRVAAD